MCGIAGFHVLDESLVGKIDAEGFAAALLDRIDYRGGDATGFAAVHLDGSTRVQKAAVKAEPFLRHWRGIDSERTRTVLLHTRYATQGAAEWPENNHPVRWGSLLVVHNGSVVNDADVFDRTGKVRNGLVDSEAIPAVIAEHGWTDAAKGLETLDGSFAIAAVDENHPGELLLARGGWSPLVWVSNGRLLAWASTEAALIGAWRSKIGTPPKNRRVVDAADGALIRVRGDKVTTGTFTPPRKVEKKTTTWTPRGPGNGWETYGNGWRWSAPKKSEAVKTVALDLAQSADDTGTNVYCLPPTTVDPRADERAGRTVWRPVYDRCACCSMWTKVEELDTAYGEEVCPGCFDILHEDMKLQGV